MCDSVAAADPAVPDPGVSNGTTLAEPLWQVRGAEAGAQESAPPCDAQCGGSFDPFGWLAWLFAAEAQEGEAEPGGEAAAPAEPADALPGEAGPSEAGTAADSPAAGDLRTGEVVARIWIAPFVDAHGVYREASHVRVVLEPAGWTLP